MTLVAFCVLLAGCESVPGKTIRGARLYASGSDALERGDSSRAIVDLEAAARLVPQGSEIQNHLGLAYWADGRSDRARLAFERALALDCDNGPARRNLERLEATTGRVGTIESDVANGGTDHGG
jgi:Flp pilus assembly protein TadD